MHVGPKEFIMRRYFVKMAVTFTGKLSAHSRGFNPITSADTSAVVMAANLAGNGEMCNLLT